MKKMKRMAGKQGGQWCLCTKTLSLLTCHLHAEDTDEGLEFRRDGFLIDCDSRFLLDLGLAEVSHSQLCS